MDKKKVIAAVVVVAAAVGGWYYYQQSHKNGELKLYGNVDIRQVSLAFNASERIAKMNVEEGAVVKKGQVLAKLETKPLELSIAKLKAQVAMQQATVTKLHNGNRPEEIRQADAAVNSAQAQYKNALVNQQRIQNLYAQSAVAKQNLDDANASLDVAQASLKQAQEAQQLAHIGARTEDVAAAEAQLQSYQAELATQEYNLSQATLVAPQDGIIRSRLLEPGDMASASKSVYLMSTNDMKWIRVYIPEKRLGEIKEGMAAQVTIDSYPDKPLQGEVGYISNTAEFTPKTVQTEELRTSLMYEVRVNVKDDANILRMGMPATVTFKK